MILETERLFLRELEAVDFQDLAEMLQDPQVMYAYGHEFSDEDVLVWLDRQKKRYLKHGFGLWALILKESGEMVGQAGLTLQPCEGGEVLEIGYLLKKRCWRHGYAREAALACREYAFSRLGAEKVYSIIKADNLASMRVARAVGMEKEKEFVTRYYSGDMLHFLFSVSREQACPAAADPFLQAIDAIARCTAAHLNRCRARLGPEQEADGAAARREETAWRRTLLAGLTRQEQSLLLQSLQAAAQNAQEAAEKNG